MMISEVSIFLIAAYVYICIYIQPMLHVSGSWQRSQLLPLVLIACTIFPKERKKSDRKKASHGAFSPTEEPNMLMEQHWLDLYSEPTHSCSSGGRLGKERLCSYFADTIPFAAFNRLKQSPPALTKHVFLCSPRRCSKVAAFYCHIH
jgi:hypothetical protein